MSETVITTYSKLVDSSTCTSKQLDVWLYDVLKRLIEAEKKIEQQGILITEQSTKIGELTTKITELEKAKTNGQANTNSAAFCWSNLPKKASIGISNIVASEKKSVAKKEKNIIIFGLPPQSGTDGDKSAVKKIFDKIEYTANMDSVKLIRFKGKNDKPGPILVELETVAIKNQVLKSARKLRGINEYENVYINPDLTESEAALEKSLRNDRNKKNEELPNVDENGLRYGMHKFNGTAESKFYWGIRNRELRKIPVKQASSTTSL